jgi:hypothetical protein
MLLKYRCLRLSEKFLDFLVLDIIFKSFYFLCLRHKK